MENVSGKERDRIEQMCNQTRGGRKDSKRASENAVAHARENLKGGEGERKPVSVRAWEWNLRGKTERQRNERLCESAFYRATECVRERETHTHERSNQSSKPCRVLQYPKRQWRYGRTNSKALCSQGLNGGCRQRGGSRDQER